MIRIALTGGPCGGKTTVTKYIAEHFGSQVIVQPETATLLMGGGFPKPGRDVSYSEEWALRFQRSILATQYNMEEEYSRMASEHMTRVVVCDRGLLDGAAFFGKPMADFLDLVDHIGPELDMFPSSTEAFVAEMLKRLYSRYDCVIHMESLAVTCPAAYEVERHKNAERIEDCEAAAARDADLREVYSGHPNYHVITDIELKSRLLRVASIISSYIERECEVKYRLRFLPELVRMGSGRGVDIRQGYLTTKKNVELRIREMGDEHFITVKSKDDFNRSECERRITPEAFDALWPSTEGRRIYKRRFFAPAGQHTWEVDTYRSIVDPETGLPLVTAECELQSASERAGLTLPLWLTDLNGVDVTKDRRYKNFELAGDY